MKNSAWVRRYISAWLMVWFAFGNGYCFKILLFGDSTVIQSYLAAAQKTSYIISQNLKTARPDVTWIVVNAGKDGECIGPGAIPPRSNFIEADSALSRYTQWINAHKDANMVLIRYGINDSRCYYPEDFALKLRVLISKLKTDVPAAKIVLETSMNVDYPLHSLPACMPDSLMFSPGFNTCHNSFNAYYKPFYDSIRAIAATDGHPLIDVWKRLDSLTQKGDWDFRIRADMTLDSSKDYLHVGDVSWFDNIHPNLHGAQVIADVETEGILNVYNTLPSGITLKPQTRLISAAGNIRCMFRGITCAFSNLPRGNEGLKIYDTHGAFVAELPAGEHAVWNCRDKQGNNVGAGVYVYHITHTAIQGKFVKNTCNGLK